MTKATILKHIRDKCLDCCCGSWREVEACQVPKCSLYILRFGKDPKPSRRGFASNPRVGDKVLKKNNQAIGE